MIRASLAIALVFLFAAACGSGVQRVHAPTSIPWEHAEALILGGEVSWARPMSGGEVQLRLRDGIEVVTVEPSAGAFARAIESCGEPCAGTTLLPE